MSQQPAASGSKYHRTIMQTLPGEDRGVAIAVDVYDVLNAFAVRCPARQHAIKKLLCAGIRGGKNNLQDLREAIEAIQRAVELCEVIE